MDQDLEAILDVDLKVLVGDLLRYEAAANTAAEDLLARFTTVLRGPAEQVEEGLDALTATGILDSAEASQRESSSRAIRRHLIAIQRALHILIGPAPPSEDEAVQAALDTHRDALSSWQARMAVLHADREDEDFLSEEARSRTESELRELYAAQLHLDEAKRRLMRAIHDALRKDRSYGPSSTQGFVRPTHRCSPAGEGSVAGFPTGATARCTADDHPSDQSPS